MNYFHGFLRPAFFRTRLPVLAALMAATAALCLWACGTESEDEDEPTVRIISPANGSTVIGPKVLLKVATTHFSFTEAAAGKIAASQHDSIAGGHIHIFLDKPEGEDASAYDNLTRYDTLTVNIATAGSHYIIVAGADSKHEDVESMLDSVQFTVTIP